MGELWYRLTQLPDLTLNKYASLEGNVHDLQPWICGDDENLKRALADFGVELDVEARRDGLTNVIIKIDDENILKRKKRTSRKINPTDATKKAAKAPTKGPQKSSK